VVARRQARPSFLLHGIASALARQTGATFWTVRAHLRGSRSVTVVQAMRYADALGLSEAERLEFFNYLAAVGAPKSQAHHPAPEGPQEAIQ
jgi:hypothetical protein